MTNEEAHDIFKLNLKNQNEDVNQKMQKAIDTVQKGLQSCLLKYIVALKNETSKRQNLIMKNQQI